VQMNDGSDELVFVPLGGLGEIGMNLALYGFGRKGRIKWLMVDCGVAFAGPDLPGIDLIVPDISFIEKMRGDLWASSLLMRMRTTLARSRICGRSLNATSTRRASPPRFSKPSASPSLARRRFQSPSSPGSVSRDRAFRCRICRHGAFDPRKLRACDPHAARHGPSFGRLENRCRAGHRQADRRKTSRRDRGGGRSSAHLRFDQYFARRHEPVGSRCRRDYARDHREGKRACRRDHFRLQCCSHSRRRRGRGSSRPLGRDGRACDGAGDRRLPANAAISMAFRIFLPRTPFHTSPATNLSFWQPEARGNAAPRSPAWPRARTPWSRSILVIK